MSLKQAATRGVRWTGGSRALIAGFQLLQLAVLAHFLTPEDFGLMAMIMVVLGLAQAYTDMGVSNAIIHRREATREQLSSLYWLNVLTGVAVFVLVVASGPAIVALYDEPRLGELLPLVALLLLILPMGQQFQVLLQKNLRFKELAVVESGAAVVGAAVAISAAFFGAGVYALVFGQLSNGICKTLAFIGVGWREWRPRLHFRKRDLHGYLGFGLFQMGEKTVNYFSERVDQLLIGVFLGAQELGYYSLAFNLVALPITQINPVLTRVAFPVFARVQDDIGKLKHGFMTVRRVLAGVNFPILLGVVAVAPVLVPLMMGEQWLASVLPIQILALVAMLRSMGNPIGSLLLAMGRPDLGFYINCVLLVVTLPMVYLGVRLGGVVGVSLALLSTVLVFFWVEYFFLIRRLLGPCLRANLASFGPALLTAGLMAFAVIGLAWAVDLETYLLLITQVAVGALLYATLNWLLFRANTVAILRLALGRDT